MRRFGSLLLLALPALGGTVTDAWISGLATTSVAARADAYYNPCGIYCGSGDPNFISDSADAFAMTLGPVRSGYIVMTGIGSGEYGAGRVSVGNYSFLCGEFCAIPNGVWMPFTLGVPFDIDVSAEAMIQGPIYGAGDITLQFSLFESTGASVVVYDAAAAAVPEPAMFTAVGLGLLLIWFFYARTSPKLTCV
jgi:hypothetical protein